MDKDRRTNLKRVVNQCRKLLEEDIEKRLLYFGIRRDGSSLDPAKLSHLKSEDLEVRRRLDEAIEKEIGGRLSRKDAVARYIRHVGFTFLNRLAAIRAMEVRGFIKETVIRRDEYGGRSLRERDIVEANPSLTLDEALKNSLVEAFREVGEQIKVLFDIDDEYSLISPDTNCCLELIRLLTEKVTEEDWQDHEITGWIYQYFNTQARREFRKAKRKPRADDIPVINQFYTPHWVVRVLTDNTLGRLWLEMNRESNIRDFCTYLVPLKNDTLPRERKRVRQIKVLDPACGSGHFLFYAFDVLYRMYREDEPDTPESEIPSLILENNLYGIDIDLRAVQLAALSLYLKAKSYNRDLRVHKMNLVCADARILDGSRRLEFLRRFDNDKPLQRIFAKLFDALNNTNEIGSLLRVREPFEKLFETRADEHVKGVQSLFVAPGAGQSKLSSEGVYVPQTKLILSRTSVSEEAPPIVIPRKLTIKEMLEELRRFEQEAIERQDMGRLLFATEAEKSVGLLALLSENYDIVLMNPPYGPIPPKCKEYVKKHYPRTHSDYYTAFIERAINLCGFDGYVGALTGRTFMFLKSHQKLREEILRYDALPEVILDLGFDVLDGAIARYAAFALKKRSGRNKKDWKEHVLKFFKLTDYQWDGKRVRFEECLSKMKAKSIAREKIVYVVKLGELANVPGSPYSYWAPKSLRDLFQKYPPLDRDVTRQKDKLKIADTKQGLATADYLRFTRFWWEVDVNNIAVTNEETHHKKWAPFNKGGKPFYFDIVYLVNWSNYGEDIKNYRDSKGKLLSRPQNEEFYFQNGLAWTLKLSWTETGMPEKLKVFYLPNGVIFSHGSYACFLDKDEHIWPILSLLRSNPVATLIYLLDPNIQNVLVGTLARIPVNPEILQSQKLFSLAKEAYSLLKEWNTGNEQSTQFIMPWILQVWKGFNPNWKPITQHPLTRDFVWSDFTVANEIRGKGKKCNKESCILALTNECLEREKILRERIEQIQKEIDEEVYSIYGISDKDKALIEHELIPHPLESLDKNGAKETKKSPKSIITEKEHIERLISYYIKKAIESDEDGIVPLIEMFPDNLFKKVRELIAQDFGKSKVDEIELEISEILEKPLKQWLAEDYFDFHVSLYRRRPIFWQLTSYQHGHSRRPQGVFSCLVHYHKLTRDTIPKILGHYIPKVKDRLTREKEWAFKRLEEARASNDRQRINNLTKEYETALDQLTEIQRFSEALNMVHNPRKDPIKLPENARWENRAIQEVRHNGWNPVIDYGVRVNIESLKEAKLLPSAADRVK